MGLLTGYDINRNDTGTLYGKYSFGNEYERMLSTEGIDSITPFIQGDLKKAGLLNDFDKRNLNVMDVGTGRQSVILAKLGAKSVQHYDISKEHVNRFKKLLESQYSQYDIKTANKDLCLDDVPSEKYDFVYLNGIVHHFSHTANGIRNCARATTENGRMWMYFYRSGSFKWFVVSMARKLINSADIDRMFFFFSQLYGCGDLKNNNVSYLMDDYFVPYIHLYSPFQYMEFMNKLGFEVRGSNELDPLTEYDHDSLHHSCSIVYERTKMLDIDSIDTGTLLCPEAEVDQLDPSLYRDDRIKRAIDSYQKFYTSYIKSNQDPIVLWGTLLALHKCAAPQYYGMKELPPRFEELDRVFETAMLNF